VPVGPIRHSWTDKGDQPAGRKGKAGDQLGGDKMNCRPKAPTSMCMRVLGFRNPHSDSLLRINVLSGIRGHGCKPEGGEGGNDRVSE